MSCSTTSCAGPWRLSPAPPRPEVSPDDAAPLVPPVLRTGPLAGARLAPSLAPHLPGPRRRRLALPRHRGGRVVAMAAGAGEARPAVRRRVGLAAGVARRPRRARRLRLDRRPLGRADRRRDARAGRAGRPAPPGRTAEVAPRRVRLGGRRRLRVGLERRGVLSRPVAVPRAAA